MTLSPRLRRLGRPLLMTLAVLLGAYLIARVLARPAPAHAWFAPRPGDHAPLVFAHQGGENLWPSNTRLAFENSVALGADVLGLSFLKLRRSRQSLLLWRSPYRHIAEFKYTYRRLV